MANIHLMTIQELYDFAKTHDLLEAQLCQLWSPTDSNAHISIHHANYSISSRDNAKRVFLVSDPRSTHIMTVQELYGFASRTGCLDVAFRTLIKNTNGKYAWYSIDHAYSTVRSSEDKGKRIYFVFNSGDALEAI